MTAQSRQRLSSSNMKDLFFPPVGLSMPFPFHRSVWMVKRISVVGRCLEKSRQTDSYECQSSHRYVSSDISQSISARTSFKRCVFVPMRCLISDANRQVFYRKQVCLQRMHNRSYVTERRLLTYHSGKPVWPELRQKSSHLI